MLLANQQEINLGSVKFGKTYNLKYTLTNKFDKILTINRVYGGCSSCTKASASKSILAPGESVDINAEFTPGSTGIQNKNIYVVHTLQGSQTTEKPDLVLKLKAIVNE